MHVFASVFEATVVDVMVDVVEVEEVAVLEAAAVLVARHGVALMDVVEVEEVAVLEAAAVLVARHGVVLS